MDDTAYRRLAQRLDELPDGFPPTADGAELRLLAQLFTPEEAGLAAQLHLTPATPETIAGQLGTPVKHTRGLLKGMAKRGLIKAGRTPDGLGYALMPFVVGIYEMQVGRIDRELAERFEAYYQQAFVQAVAVEPSFHRVLPVRETIPVDMELQPYENAAALIDQAQAWGVVDCICRVQKSLIGDACGHPVDVCMVLSPHSGAFDSSKTIRALDRKGALDTLHSAAEAGLVHAVSNHQEGLWYICSCCTCSCGILRGLKEFGLANVVARSRFVNQVDEALCVGCELCEPWCQFDALSHAELALVDTDRCVGCGVCVIHCPEGALELATRPGDQIWAPPRTLEDWRATRAESRGLDMDRVL